MRPGCYNHCVLSLDRHFTLTVSLSLSIQEEKRVLVINISYSGGGGGEGGREEGVEGGRGER